MPDFTAAGYYFLLTVGASVLTWVLVARWFIIPWLARQDDVAAYSALLLPHTLRFIGLAFIVEGVATPALPAEFAVGAAWGDVAAALAAFVALAWVRYRLPGSQLALLAACIVGLADFAVAFSTPLRIGMDPATLGATWFIPTMVVPPLFVTQVLILRRMYGARDGSRS